MSRIGRMPVEIPSGVTVDLKGTNVRVKGPKGELQRTFSNQIGISMESNRLVITRGSDLPAERALHGTTRAVLANMVNFLLGLLILIPGLIYYHRLQMTPALLWLWIRGVRFMYSVDPHLPPGTKPRWRDYFDAARRGLVPGPAQFLPVISAYYKPGFHPSQLGGVGRAVDYLARSPAARASH